MNRWVAGLVAGFAATMVLSLLMMTKAAMGLVPQLDVIAMLGQMLGTGQGGAWGTHFLIGTVGYGLAYALIAHPETNEGFVVRGLGLGLMAPIMTLMLHLVFGAALGGVYSVTHRRDLAHVHG